MSWLYQPLLSGGAQLLAFVAPEPEPVADRVTGAGAFTPAEIRAHKARQRRFLASLPSAKLAPEEVALLARLMQEMRSLQTLPPAEREPEIAAEVEQAVAETLAKPAVREEPASFTPAAEPEGESFATEIEAMRSTIVRMIAARQEAEEDDMETLLLFAA